MFKTVAAKITLLPHTETRRFSSDYTQIMRRTKTNGEADVVQRTLTIKDNTTEDTLTILLKVNSDSSIDLKVCEKNKTGKPMLERTMSQQLMITRITLKLSEHEFTCQVKDLLKAGPGYTPNLKE